MKASHAAALAIAVGFVVLVVYLFPEDSPSPKTELDLAPSPLLSDAPAPPSVAAAERAQIEDSQPSSPTSIAGQSTDSRQAPAVGPRGRVLEAETDRPVGDLVVRMGSGTKILAEAITGPDGSFSLPEPDRSRRRIEVVSDAWRITPRTHRLDEAESSGATELLFRAERIVAAPLRGQLVDRRTGEPIPEFLVQARGPRGEVRESVKQGDPKRDQPAVTFTFVSPPLRVENLVTDAEGWFVSEGGFEAGLLDLVLFDHPHFLKRGANSPDEEKSVEHRHTFDGANPPKDAEIKLAIGPTYRLDFALPSGTAVEDFYATFPLPSAGLRQMHRAVALDPGSPMAAFFGDAMKPNALEQEAPLREDESVWARFRDPVRAIPRASGEDGNYVLHVRSRDGYWSGSAAVDSIEGIYPESVPISLDARGSIEGTVLDGAGKPVPPAWIQVSAAAAPASAIREAGADTKGRFAFPWLPEGEYTVIVQTDSHAEWRSTISVAKGSTERLDVRLTSGAPLGTVAGALRSRTGQHRSKGGIVSLKSLENPDFFRIKTADYRERNGEYTAEFVFDGVPNGEYELSLAPQDNLRWEPRVMRISSPAEGLEFVCEDDTPTFDLAFRAVDAQTGSPIETRWVILWQNDPLDDVRLDSDWTTKLYQAIPEGVPLRWMVRAEGYRLATGDETDIRVESDHRVVEAKLERGWGQLFKVTTRDQKPLEGAELFADGNSVGATDAQGMLSMNLAAKPKSLEFRYEDWVVVWGSVDPNEDGFGWGAETPVYLGPRE